MHRRHQRLGPGWPERWVQVRRGEPSAVRCCREAKATSVVSLARRHLARNGAAQLACQSSEMLVSSDATNRVQEAISAKPLFPIFKAKITLEVPRSNLQLDIVQNT